MPWTATTRWAHFREQFALPDGVIYLDGNSLGALPRQTPAMSMTSSSVEMGAASDRRLEPVLVGAPVRLGGLLAPLIGAKPTEVVITDTISINLFKLIAYAAQLAGDRRVILSEGGEFPDLTNISPRASPRCGPISRTGRYPPIARTRLRSLPTTSPSR